MAVGELPAEVRAFIREHITSIEQLEILTFLYDLSPRMETSEAIARALYLSPESTARQLHYFHEKKLVEKGTSTPPSFGVPARETVSGRSIGKVTDFYRLRRVSVINEVFSNPISTLQTFADAFVLGKKKS